jgi:hypothetical protein
MLEVDLGPCATASTQQACLRRDLVVGVHRAPLEGRVGLRHVRRHAHRHRRRAGPSARARADSRWSARTPVSHDAAHVLVGLGGQADHEVELHLRPPAREHALGRLMSCASVTFLFTTSRMRWRARLGREGEPRARARFWISSSSSSPRPYARSDDTPRLTFSGASASASPSSPAARCTSSRPWRAT